MYLGKEGGGGRLKECDVSSSSYNILRIAFAFVLNIVVTHNTILNKITKGYGLYAATIIR